MNGLRAIWLALRDVWYELSIVTLASLAGGLLSLLVVPLPFVLAAHYGLARRIVRGRAAGWRDWVEAGRTHARFFYKWVGLLALTVAIFAVDLRFYLQRPNTFLFLLFSFFMGFFLVWVFVQLLVPPLYLEQQDPRLTLALRNAIVLAFQDPFSLLLVWMFLGLLSLVFLSFIPFFVLFVPLLAALIGIRLVRLRLAQLNLLQEEVDEGV